MVPLSIVVVLACLAVGSRDAAKAATASQDAGSGAASAPQAANADHARSPAELHRQYDPSFSWLAWQLFLRIMTPTNGSLTFETWTEQCQLNPSAVGCPSAAVVAAAQGGASRHVRLLHRGLRTKKDTGSDCSSMINMPVGGYPPPSNLTSKAIFCEEVYVSPAEAEFIKSGLTTLADQKTYGDAHSGAINFPGTEVNLIRLDTDSVEVKVDWVPASSFHPTFACPDTTERLYTETINGTCYALVAIHIASKSMPNWLWATFEPESRITNPNRCDPALYGACLDPWGTSSRQEYGKGIKPQQSAQLKLAMGSARLDPAFRNYFLTGVQTEFVESDGHPVQLGNSFVEFNQAVAPGNSSCMTCHRYAAFDGKQTARGAPENNFGHPPRGWPSVGYACNAHQNANCIPAAKSTTQDFSWLLGLMPYSSTALRSPIDSTQYPTGTSASGRKSSAGH